MHKFIFLVFALFGLICADPTVDQFHIVTVASHKTVGLKQLLHTCENVFISLDILGLGLPYRGNGQKLTYMIDYLSAIPDEEVVMFVDGYDILILAPKDEILARFVKLNTPCLFSAELYCFPHTKLASLFPESPTKFKYLNSGSFIGYAGHLRTLLKNLGPIKENQSDQGQITLYYLDHLDEIALDYTCELFLPLQDLVLDDLEIDHSRNEVKCLLTGTTPPVIHGNGLSKPLYQEIYDRLFTKNPH